MNLSENRNSPSMPVNIVASYETFPNLPGQSLSWGEIANFNDFQTWLGTVVEEPKGGKYPVSYGDEKEVAFVSIVKDACNPDRNTPQVVIRPGGLLETRYTLTGDGLKREVYLPGEPSKPLIDILRGKEGAKTLAHLKHNLHRG